MGNQGGKDCRDLSLDFSARINTVEIETLFNKTGVELTSHKAVRVHQSLVEGDIGAYADDDIFFQGTAHTQDGLCACLPHTISFEISES